MTQQNATPSSLVGQIIGGRYRLTQLLGQGGMGEVYAAEHVHITKRVAVKLLHADIGNNEEAVARFRQEAQSASSIGHDNIIRIDDFFALDDGRVCLCMEYLEGQSLDAVIHAIGRNDAVRGLNIMCQVCDGLGAAHAKGIIHRDMKPENVFLSRRSDGSDQVKILDFGIAKVLGDDGNNLTKTGTVFGTPHYMSPEQALGHAVDCRADVYSLGVMLFEMVTGEVPFKAESFMGVLSKHITQPTPRPSSITPHGKVSGPTEEVILRAMAKEPAERFQDMVELKTALHDAREAMGGPHAPQGNAPATRLGAAAPTGPGGVEAVVTEVEPKGEAGEAVSPTEIPKAKTRPLGGTIMGVFLAGVVLVTVVGVVALWMKTKDTRERAAPSNKTIVAARQDDARPSPPEKGSVAKKDEDASPTSDTTLPVAAADDARPAKRSGKRAKTPAEANGSGQVAKPKRETYTVTVVSIPNDAAVFRDGRKLRQRTPIKLTVRPGQRIKLRLAKAGHRDTMVTVKGEARDRTVRARLKGRRFGVPGGGSGEDSADGL